MRYAAEVSAGRVCVRVCERIENDRDEQRTDELGSCM